MMHGLRLCISNGRIIKDAVFQVLLSCRGCDGQVLMEELKMFNIDPLNLNGTEPYTELTIDQIIMQASGGSGSK